MVRMGPSPGEEPNPQGWGRALALHHDAPRQLSCTLLPSPVVLGMLLAEFAWGGDRWCTAPLTGGSVLLQGASPPSCTSTPSPRWHCPASSASPPEVSHQGTGCCGKRGGDPSSKQRQAPECLVSEGISAMKFLARGCQSSRLLSVQISLMRTALTAPRSPRCPC